MYIVGKRKQDWRGETINVTISLKMGAPVGDYDLYTFNDGLQEDIFSGGGVNDEGEQQGVVMGPDIRPRPSANGRGFFNDGVSCCFAEVQVDVQTELRFDFWRSWDE